MSWEAWGTPPDPEPTFCPMCGEQNHVEGCELGAMQARALKAENELAALRAAGRFINVAAGGQPPRWQHVDLEYDAEPDVVTLYLAPPAPAVQADPLWPIDGLYPDMQPPATSRDRWMFDQGRLAERRASAVQAAQGLVPLTDEQIESGRKVTFSTSNPFCPCDSKTMRKAVRWAEHAHGIGIRPAGDEGAGNG